MAAFQFVARRAAGEQVTGVIEAASQREVLQKLADDSLFPVQIAESRPAPTAVLSKRRVRARDLATLYGQLSDLLHSGVALLRSLEILERQSSRPALKAVLIQLRADVSDGTSLADAMSRHPKVFSDLATNMVRAGQEGGFLEDVLRRIAEFTDHQEELKARVLGALAYPLFLLAAAGCVLTALLTFFVPMFEAIFERMREAGKLPVLTEWLLQTSEFIQSYYLFIIVGVVVVIGFARGFLKSDQGQLWLDRFRLWAPGFGAITRGLAIARFSRILGTMLANGIPILTALRIAKDSAGNRILAAAIDKAADNVSAGNPLGSPLRASGQIPPDVAEMIIVGEESNNLQQVLITIADTTERRITRQMDLLVRPMEPVLLLVMAGFTLIVVAALLLPIFKMSTVIR